MNKAPGKGEMAVFLLAKMFRDHAGKDGDKDHLSKKEAKELLKEEFPNILGDTSDPSMVDNILKDLDTNGDSKLDFQEFMILALTLAMVCNELM
ncbi:protein S100-A1 [Lates japonicus]